MRPGETAKEFMKAYPSFSGLLSVKMLKRAGKGGWKTKSVYYQFVVDKGVCKRFVRNVNMRPCGHWVNIGICRACLRIFLTLELTPSRMISPIGSLAVGDVCRECLSRYQVPLIKEIPPELKAELDLTKQDFKGERDENRSSN